MPALQLPQLSPFREAPGAINAHFSFAPIQPFGLPQTRQTVSPNTTHTHLPVSLRCNALPPLA